MNKRNWLVLLLIGAFAITTFNSCKKEEDTEETGETEWTRSHVFIGDPRSGAASFTIDDVAYLVGGFLKTNEVLNDAYSFNGDSWSSRADFIGPARHSAVGFSVSGKGYVGLGYGGEGGSLEALKDFYRYDPAANSWTKIADFPGEARWGAVAFSLGTYAYVGLGTRSTDKTYSDFYRYDPSADTWSQIETPFSYKKGDAFAFVIGEKAYVGGGFANNDLPGDFYSFDGETWTAEEDLNTESYDARRYRAVAFSIGNSGYVVSGRSFSGVVSTVWKYDPSAGSWSDGSEALGSPREKAIGFSLDGVGYITTGVSGTSYLDDTWEFRPVR